ncbi:hypothetical protein EOL70_15250 [Leucothrix sargassi]|nr:hypothetical protein EOL70_15250 [Leucothrix sargassi]
MAKIFNYGLLLISMLLLTACGGGGGSSTSIAEPETPTTGDGPILESSVLTVNNKPVSGARFASYGGTQNTQGVTASDGVLEHYDDSTTHDVYIGDVLIGRVDASDVSDPLTIESLIAANSAAQSNPTLQNLPTILLEDQGSTVSHYALPNTLAELDPISATILTLGGKPISGVDFVSGSESGSTSQNGVFIQDGSASISFQVAGLDIGSATTSELPTSIEALTAANDTDNPVIKNLASVLTELNAVGASNPIASFRLYDLEQQLLKPASLPENRVLGVNLETPQAEADHINQPLITADLFRVARPFAEGSCEDIVYDENGWPTAIPESCASANTAEGESKYAFTRILQFAPGASFPEGPYTVYYDGKGQIHFSGMGCNGTRIEEGLYTVEVKAANACPDDSGKVQNINNIRGLEVSITQIDETDPIRNIRIVMSGGICKGNPFQRVLTEDACSSEAPYIAFNELYKNNDDVIVFNPAFLDFYKDFRVLRFMNAMEASPRRPESQVLNPCLNDEGESLTGTEYEVCLLHTMEWEDRPTLQTAQWGGSYKTSVLKRLGIPVEVGIALANQLEAHPWFNIPHNASDEYVEQYATLVADELDDSLITHIEYSNEIWNAGFWGHHYVMQKGYNDPEISALENYPFRNSDYSVRTRYYAKRSTEVFKIFESVYFDTDRLKRILGGQHKFHTLADNMLAFEDTKDHTDAVAIAPYFHGCWSRKNANGTDHSSCSNTDTVAKTMSEATSLEDVFAVMNAPYDDTVLDASLRGDPDSVEATIKLIAPQVAVTNSYSTEDHPIDLYAYEGGQHLTVSWGDNVTWENSDEADARKSSLYDFFQAANRDSRMGEFYTRLLEGWKEAGAKQFVLFTSPQSFNRYGSFGLKEHLGMSRSDSPKYDAVLTFQEALLGCWPEFTEAGC